MGHWGVKSYENDETAAALDAGFERVHGRLYEELMDDRNPLTFEQAQQRLADRRTLKAAVESLRSTLDPPGPLEAWDELARLALVGILIHHAELGVPIAEAWRSLAIDWLENEDIDWDETTARGLRRHREINLLKRVNPAAKSAPPELE